MPSPAMTATLHVDMRSLLYIARRGNARDLGRLFHGADNGFRQDVGGKGADLIQVGAATPAAGREREDRVAVG